MLPQPGSRSGSGQTSFRKNAAPQSVPYLKVEDLTSDPVRARILGVQTGGGRYNDVTVKLTIRGKSYFYGLRTDNPNYEILVQGLGTDENRWPDKDIMIGLEWNTFYEKNFIRVFEAPAAPAPSESKKGK